MSENAAFKFRCWVFDDFKRKGRKQRNRKTDFAPIYGALYAVGGKDWSADLILRPFFRVGGKAFEVVSAEERFKTCAKVLLADFDLKKEFSDTEKVKMQPMQPVQCLCPQYML